MQFHQSCSFRSSVFLAGLFVSSLTLAADWMPGSTEWDKLPEIKRTKSGQYLTPKQAYDLKAKEKNTVLFVDVRTRAEAMYVGMPTDIDALVPFVEHPEIMSDWDDKRTMYTLEPNQDFIPELERRLKSKALGKEATIILICRSGDRSSKAADRLEVAGYKRVYSVAEGFEGDTAKAGSKQGQRSVNGWKNSDLPWSYKLDKAKMYFPN